MTKLRTILFAASAGLALVAGSGSAFAHMGFSAGDMMDPYKFFDSVMAMGDGMMMSVAKGTAPCTYNITTYDKDHKVVDESVVNGMCK
jgi:hypothetical protein